jgi:hypothetical protein
VYLTDNYLSIWSNKWINIPSNITFQSTTGHAFDITATTDNSFTIVVDPTGELTLDGVNITRMPGTTGRGITNSGVLTLINGEIRDNFLTNGGGGAVHISPNGKFIMYGGEISDNTAPLGGGVRNLANVNYISTFIMYGGEITENTASVEGDGVSNSGIFTMRGCKIFSNEAYGLGNADGGGVHNRLYFTIGNVIMHDG